MSPQQSGFRRLVLYFNRWHLNYFVHLNESDLIFASAISMIFPVLTSISTNGRYEPTAKHKINLKLEHSSLLFFFHFLA